MTPAEVALLVLLVLTVLTAAPAVVYLGWRVHRLKAEAAKASEEERSFVGLSYRPRSGAVRDVMGPMQRIVDALQQAGCKEVAASFMEQKNALIDLARAADPESLDCAKMRQAVRDSARQLADGLADNVPYDVDAGEIASAVEAVWKAALDAVCEDGSVDVDRLDRLVTDLYKSVCHKA